MAIFSKQSLNRIDASQQALPPARHAVLIVDDREANLSVMSAILRPHYRLLEARDGQEALNLIAALEAGVDLACVVSDYRMPGINGVELLRRAEPLLQWTARIIVSGFIDLDAIIDSINHAHIHRFIAKPFDAHEFLDAVASAVATYEQARAGAHERDALRQEVQRLRAELAAAQALAGARG